MNDSTYHILEILMLAIPLWAGLAYLVSIVRAFPPHRHVNGTIIYPPGYTPGRSEQLYKEQK